MAVLDHVGVDHLVSKISNKIGEVETKAIYARVDAESANSKAESAILGSESAYNKAEEALKKTNNVEIWYTTSDNQPLIPAGKNTHILSDTYENGRGVLVVNPSTTTLTYITLGASNRSRLTSLVLPCNHFQGINNFMASAITGFTCFEVPDSVKTIQAGAFIGSKFSEIKLGSGLKTIQDAAFAGSSTLETIVIPDSVTEIGGGAFGDCTSLKTVKLSNSLEVIYANTFSGCTSLETIEIPDSVTEIGGAAFAKCTSLKTVKIGSGVTLINNNAFRLSSGVTKYEIHAITPPSIGMSVFNGDEHFKIYVPIESVDAYKQAANWTTYANRIVGVIFEDENIVPGEKLAKAPYVLPWDLSVIESLGDSGDKRPVTEDEFRSIANAISNNKQLVIQDGSSHGLYSNSVYYGGLGNDIRINFTYTWLYGYFYNVIITSGGVEDDADYFLSVNYDVYLPDSNMKIISYQDLKNLRNGARLIPGMKYRITDYVTTTTQEGTLSAGHLFDIIVEATSNNTLSEEAKAVYHEGDTYFTTNGANLDAWKLKYSLDNDVNRFVWADEANGKGVIYYMKDEWTNECPYDFKNIQFLRGLYTDGGGIAPDGEEDLTTYCYTFGWENEDGTMLDTTVFGNNGHLLNAENQIPEVYGNIIKEYFTYTYEIENPTSIQLHLNNIVFLSTYSFEDNMYYGCFSNSFGFNCNNNSFGNNCYRNSFENNCGYNSFGNSCIDNSFRGSCYHNSGNNLVFNSFGFNCNNNSFGNDFSRNSLGNDCTNNSFGNNFYNNSFGDSCYGNKIEIAYTECCHFNDGCQYIILTNNETASYSYKVKNYKIIRGVKGTKSSPIEIATERNRAYETKVAKNSAGEIKIYCEADLIA